MPGHPTEYWQQISQRRTIFALTRFARLGDAIANLLWIVEKDETAHTCCRNALCVTCFLQAV
jgi:hypothetical protein